MAIKTSGPLSLTEIVAEYGGSAPHSLSEYRLNPTGPINFSDFYGKSAFTPVVVTHNSGSGTQVAPTGCSNVVIEVWGGGASGRGVTRFATAGGDGGGAGGYARSSYSISGGQTLSYSVGAGGTGPFNGFGAGGNSSVSSGTKSITTLTGNGGPNKSGGTGTGGNQANATGGAGSTGQTNGIPGQGGAPVNGIDGNGAGAGGAGAVGNTVTPGANTSGDPGYPGRVRFHFS